MCDAYCLLDEWPDGRDLDKTAAEYRAVRATEEVIFLRLCRVKVDKSSAPRLL